MTSVGVVNLRAVRLISPPLDSAIGHFPNLILAKRDRYQDQELARHESANSTAASGYQVSRVGTGRLKSSLYQQPVYPISSQRRGTYSCGDPRSTDDQGIHPGEGLRQSRSLVPAWCSIACDAHRRRFQKPPSSATALRQDHLRSDRFDSRLPELALPRAAFASSFPGSGRITELLSSSVALPQLCLRWGRGGHAEPARKK